MRLSKHIPHVSGGASALDIMARAKQMEAEGKRVIDLSVGEPDFDTPPNVIEAAYRALRGGKTRYAPPQGIPELREAIADYETRRKGVSVSADEIVVTSGGKPVLLYAALMLLDAGDEMVFPDPGYTPYRYIAGMRDATPVPMPLFHEDGFKHHPEFLRTALSHRTRLLVLNTPHNPTGRTLNRRDMEAISRIVLSRSDLILLSDEVYSTLTYDREHFSPLSIEGMKPRTIVLESFSKSYSMTGWRIGYGIFPREMVPGVVKIIANTASCAATFTQYAALEALLGPRKYVEEMRAKYRQRRNSIVRLLRNVPRFSLVEPKGAFYAFPGIALTGMSAARYAELLIERYGVAVVPGTAFGRYGESHIRLSFAAKTADIEEAVDRMKLSVEELCS